MGTEFRNATELEFTEILDELERTYHFPGGEVVTLQRVRRLHVSESGGHRLWCEDGSCHYVPTGWLHLCWTVSVGGANFSR
jgi:hypothetical protein